MCPLVRKGERRSRRGQDLGFRVSGAKEQAPQPGLSHSDSPAVPRLRVLRFLDSFEFGLASQCLIPKWSSDMRRRSDPIIHNALNVVSRSRRCLTSCHCIFEGVRQMILKMRRHPCLLRVVASRTAQPPSTDTDHRSNSEITEHLISSNRVLYSC